MIGEILLFALVGFVVVCTAALFYHLGRLAESTESNLHILKGLERKLDKSIEKGKE